MFGPYVCKLLSFGLGGHSEHYAKQGSSSGTLSGYDRPHNWQPRKDTDYSDCIVIDKRPCLEHQDKDIQSKAISFVYAGPLCCVDLPPGTVDKIGQGYEHIALKAFGSLSSLDSVSLDIYTEGWKQHGAHIGHIVNDEIVWNDQEVCTEEDINHLFTVS